MARLFRWLALLSVLIGWPLLAAEPSPRITQVMVKAELERLMSLNRFEIQGLDYTENVKGHLAGSELLGRLQTLLEDFDHIIVQDGHGGVARVIILGEKSADRPPPASSPQPAENNPDQGDIVVVTQRKGSSHSISVNLEGPNQQRVQQEMLIDTGAEQVVLPDSLIQSLGLDQNGLREQQVQTANGPVAARVGRLPAIWFGNRRIQGVEAAFIDDRRLGGNALLGMNVLGRFRMTIDDSSNTLTLSGN